MKAELICGPCYLPNTPIDRTENRNILQKNKTRASILNKTQVYPAHYYPFTLCALAVRALVCFFSVSFTDCYTVWPLCFMVYRPYRLLSNTDFLNVTSCVNFFKETFQQDRADRAECIYIRPAFGVNVQNLISTIPETSAVE